MATTYEELEGDENGKRPDVPVEQLNALGQPGNPVRVPDEPTIDGGPGGASQEGMALATAQVTESTIPDMTGGGIAPTASNDPAQLEANVAADHDQKANKDDKRKDDRVK